MRRAAPHPDPDEETGLGRACHVPERGENRKILSCSQTTSKPALIRKTATRPLRKTTFYAVGHYAIALCCRIEPVLRIE
jgi:hypothetical protein